MIKIKTIELFNTRNYKIWLIKCWSYYAYFHYFILCYCPRNPCNHRHREEYDKHTVCFLGSMPCGASARTPHGDSPVAVDPKRGRRRRSERGSRLQRPRQRAP